MIKHTYKTYAAQNNTAVNWRKSIDSYYKGGLEEFSDARTIRIHHAMCREWLAWHDKICGIANGQLGEEIRLSEQFEVFAEERAVMTAILEELSAWLARQSLEP